MGTLRLRGTQAKGKEGSKEPEARRSKLTCRFLREAAFFMGVRNKSSARCCIPVRYEIRKNFSQLQKVFAFPTYCIYNNSMEITFDPAKDAKIQEKHGVSLADAVRLDWDGMLVTPDTRRDYGEDRYRAIGLLGGRLYCVVFTPREETLRIISLRKASNKEVDEYEQK